MNAKIVCILLPTTLAGAVLLSMVDAAAKSFVLLGVAAVTCLALRRASAATRHLIWLSALAAALVIPVLSFYLPQWRVLPAWLVVARGAGTEPVSGTAVDANFASPTHTQTAQLPEVYEPAAPAVPYEPLDPLGPPDPLEQSVSTSPVTLPTEPRIPLTPTALLIGWGLGTVVLLLRMARSAWALHRLSSSLPVVTTGPIATAMQEVARELRLGTPLLYLGSAGAMPMVWGIGRGRMLLPAEAVEWDAVRSRAVLLHELAHLRRHDPLTQAIAQLARALHWFNPLAWLAVRCLRVEQERACDDYVLRGGVNPSDYAGHVLELATNLQPAPRAASVALAMADRTRIEGRLQTILDAARSRRALSRWLVAATLLVVGSVTFSLAMLQAADEAKPTANDRPSSQAVEPTEQGRDFEDSASATQPPAPSPETSRNADGQAAHGNVSEELEKAYALAPGQILKRVAPPFPASRLEYYRRSPYQSTEFPAGPANWFFTWGDDGLKHFGMAFDSSGVDVATLLNMLACIKHFDEIEGDQKLSLKSGIKGDFVVRAGTPIEETLDALAKLLREECDVAVRFTRREVERKVIVIRGKLRITSQEGRRKDHIEIYSKAPAAGRYRKEFSGFYSQFLGAVGHVLDRRLVDEADVETTRRFAEYPPPSWGYDVRSPSKLKDEGEEIDAKLVLQHLTEQTELTFQEETRKLHVTFVDVPTDPEQPGGAEQRDTPASTPGAPVQQPELKPEAQAKVEPQKPKTGAKLNPATEQKLEWGEPVNGLCMALAWPPALGEPAAGEVADFYLAVLNTSQAPVRLCMTADSPDERWLDLKDKDRILFRIRSKEPTGADVTLEPREAVFLRLFPEAATQPDAISAGAGIASDVRQFPDYRLKAALKVAKAPAGAWSGTLVTPDTRAGVGAEAPKNRKAQELFKVWLGRARLSGKIPGGFIARLGEHVKTFVKANAADAAGAPYAQRMEPLLSRLDGTRDWQPVEAATLLNTIAAVSDAPLVVMLEEIAGGRVQHGLPFKPELENAPWGEPVGHGLGLRTATLIGPGIESKLQFVDWIGNVVTNGRDASDKAGVNASGSEIRLGTPLGCRILIHNAGKEPVVFRTRTWHHIEPTAKDAKGAEIGMESVTRYTRAPLVTFRLEPGRYIELVGPGFGLGKYGFHDFKNADIATWISAKEGDVVTLTPGVLPLNDWNEVEVLDGQPRWWLDFITARLNLVAPLPADPAERKELLNQAMSDLFRQDVHPAETETAAFLSDTSPQALTNLAKRLHHRPGLRSWAGPLQSGPTRFRVLPADPNAPKPPDGPAATPAPASPAKPATAAPAAPASLKK